MTVRQHSDQTIELEFETLHQRNQLLELLVEQLTCDLEYARIHDPTDDAQPPPLDGVPLAGESVQHQLALMLVDGPMLVFRRSARTNWPIEYVSPNIIRLGYRADDLTSNRRGYRAIVHPDDFARVAANVQAASAAGRATIEQRYRICDAYGKARQVYDFTRMRRDSQGTISYFDSYVLDMTGCHQPDC